MGTKQDIRKNCMCKRELLSPEERINKSNVIAKKVIEHPLFIKANTIYCYIDCKSEVMTHQIIETAWLMNKKVAVPRVLNKQREMEFYYINTFEDLEPGYFGLLEPLQSMQKADEEDALVIIPCVGFDLALNRLGYGKGFYDKYLATHKLLDKIMIAYTTQCVTCIPAESMDIKPDIVITEG
ncbi:MAG: 5-formyltetrahydrofolate cyclo-ligase [Lachnospiraceae bacterium]|nr:5-formyltetrahydrofolate cyclo-ligase [Lachnospiraceae bacterium]